MSKKHFAVILAGAGKMDGNDLHEAVLLLAAIDESGAQYSCFAPDIEQHHVVDHVTGEEMPDRRNVLRESARIARGDIRPLSQLNVAEYDALVFPGGFGVAKNLCTYALAGDNFTVNAEVEAAIKRMHELHKPIGAMCIAPILLARVLGKGVVTLGGECEAAKSAEKLGAMHHISGKRDVIVDPKNLLFTTPCYMLDSSIADVAAGAKGLVRNMLDAMH